MEIFVIWIVLSIIAGAVASGKGRSGVGWFLFSILLSPLIGLLAVALLARKTPLPVTVADRPVMVRPDPTSQIASLASLRDSGAISEDEYAAKKSELLARV